MKDSMTTKEVFQLLYSSFRAAGNYSPLAANIAAKRTREIVCLGPNYHRRAGQVLNAANGIFYQVHENEA